MPVPQSVPIKVDVGFKAPKYFRRTQPFDNSKNIVNILTVGGVVRGTSLNDFACQFEIYTKKEVSDGLSEREPGSGRWVPSSVVERMIQAKEIFARGDEGNYVYCHLTEDEVFADGFPANWGVRHTPSTNSTYLFAPGDNGEVAICERPGKAIISAEDWVRMARAMALGLFEQRKLLDAVMVGWKERSDDF